MNKFNTLCNILLEAYSFDFNEKFCYILSKHQLIQPTENNLQCIYIDKHLLKQLKNRTLIGDIEYSLEKIENKINKFVVERLNDINDNAYIKKYSLDLTKNEANFGIPYICECEKSKLKIKILIKYDKKFNRFYAFAKTCWLNIHNHIISKYHQNEIIKTLQNENNQ